ncbi:FAD-dependent oxidoreductase [Spongiibacter tropicus]|uniref:FAD-dependent oxidoreductase n=1 Tax=Spongiibacter tropicus TaxID=454602 RepID=UPI002355C464|nr:FAD-dependent oxidoreductase [Spongiibacter tropicus]|tara:strand:- start:33269 stop:35437 length:2169 start_codon:yes stop_codon:yes gene_type:complete
MRRKGLLLVVLLLLVAGVLGSGLTEYLSLAGLKSLHADIVRVQTARPWLFALLFFLGYVLITALSLPGAAVMTLAGGAVLGFWQGLVLVSFASTIGATLAFLVARYLLRDSLQQRFPERLKKIDAGIASEGGFYLFTLRLVPLFPFFLINLLMGLTALPARRFYWVSQLGMLPGTAVYVNAGVQLGQVDSLSGILSPSLIVAFSLLGIFPLLAKRVLGSLQHRRVYRGWRRPVRADRNLVVIGAGAGGLVSAYIAAALRAKVTLVEAGEMGGDCLNTGCVPSKALIRSARLASQLRRADHFGVNVEASSVNFTRVMARVRQVIADIAPHDSVERYTGLGVEVIKGYARFVDPWTLEIDSDAGQSRRLTARNIIIASGAEPVVPPIPGMAELGFETSETLWAALASYTHPPARVLVLGGGAIGCELSQCLAQLGSKVSQLEMLPRLLAREDEAVSASLARQFAEDGVEVFCRHRALRCEQRSGEKCLVIEDLASGDVRALPYDMLICAVGRRPRLEGFGLETLGIDTALPLGTNAFLQTRFPHIYAAGDVVGGPFPLTHVAAHQAWYASVNALFGRFKKFPVDYSVIPRVIYTDPEVARVGLNEQEAREQGVAVEVSRYALSDLDRAICDGDTGGFISVLTPPGKDRILGVTLVGAQAGELLAEYVLAMKHGLGLRKVLATTHAYPTLTEANKYVAGEWRKAHQPEWVLRLLARFFRWQRGGQ